jgi:hypothetical protein
MYPDSVNSSRKRGTQIDDRESPDRHLLVKLSQQDF